MKRSAILCVLVAMLCMTALCEEFITVPYLRKVNDAANGWKASHQAYFTGKSKQDIQKLLGVIKMDDRLPERSLFDMDMIFALPDEFSWRDKGMVGDVRNQGSCGSCWVFGGVEALSDRFRIHGKNVNVSATDPVTCDDGFFSGNDGCHGGSPYSLWSYLKGTGSVTSACKPYLTSEGGPIPTCPPSEQPCLNFVDTPVCNKTCVNGDSYAKDKLQASSVYSVAPDQNQIRAEIFKNGPVEGAFTVFSDFVGYKSGVYKKSSSATPLGGHAIEIVGWGVEHNEPYWLVRNSWTTSWGDQGYFKILRGSDECGIESDIVAGMPLLQ